MDLETAETILRGRAKLNPYPKAKNILWELTDEARAHRLGPAGQGPMLDILELEEELIAFLQGPSLPDSGILEAVAAILAAKEDEETARILEQDRED